MDKKREKLRYRGTEESDKMGGREGRRRKERVRERKLGR